jgi:hypothetical protein
MKPSKALFHIFAGISLQYFKDYYKDEQQSFIDDENKRIEEAPNSKLKSKAKSNMKTGLDQLKNYHNRTINALEFAMKSNVSRLNIEAQEHLNKSMAGVKLMVEKIKSPEDFPRLITLIDLYNTGAFKEVFADLDGKTAEELEEENYSQYNESDKDKFVEEYPVDAKDAFTQNDPEEQLP